MDAAEYGAMAAVEDRHWWFQARLRTVRAALRRHARPGAGLDVSCGTGLTLARLGRWVRVGADLSPLALAHCRGRGLARLARADLARLPFRDATFPTVTCLDTLEHVEDDAAALGELRRVLVPGGTLVLTVPAHPWMYSGHDAALHHVRRYRRGELRDRVRAAGLELAALRYSNVALFPAVAAVRLARRGRAGARSDTSSVPAAPVNGLLFALTAAEAALPAWLPTPFGVSLVCIARRPRAS